MLVILAEIVVQWPNLDMHAVIADNGGIAVGRDQYNTYQARAKFSTSTTVTFFQEVSLDNRAVLTVVPPGDKINIPYDRSSEVWLLAGAFSSYITVGAARLRCLLR